MAPPDDDLAGSASHAPSFDALVDHMLEAVVTVDMDRRVLTWSSGAERIYGWTAAEAIGRSVFSMICPNQSEADVQTFLQRLAVEGHRTEVNSRVRKDGSTLTVEATYVLLKDETGQPVRVLGVAREVRREDALMTALRASEAQMRAIVTGMAEGVVMHDVTGRIVVSNDAACRILGLTRAQLEGRTSRDPRWRVIHEDGAEFPGDEHPATVVLRTGAPQRDVIMGVYAPEGVLRWISVSAEPLRVDGSRALFAVVVTFVDVTEARRAEAALRATVAENEALVVELRAALQKVKTLSGFLPICMHCKKIRDDKGYWERLEEYLTAHTDALLSHGLCPDCAREHYGAECQ